MSWVKLDDGFALHAKMRAAGLEAVGLWVAALAYCARYRTNGRITRDALADVWPWPAGDLQKLTGKLVKVGLWETSDDGWQVHDYLDYQESRREIDLKRKQAVRRARDYRERKMGVTRDGRVTHAREDAPRPETRRDEYESGSDLDLGEEEHEKEGASTVSAIDDCWRVYQDTREALGLRRFGGVNVAPRFEAFIATAIAEVGTASRVVAAITASGIRAREQKPRRGEFVWLEHFEPETALKSKNLLSALDWEDANCPKATLPPAPTPPPPAPLPTCPAWEEAKAKLRGEVSPKVFETWFAQLGARQTNGHLVLVARAGYVHDYVRLNFEATLRDVAGDYELVLEE